MRLGRDDRRGVRAEDLKPPTDERAGISRVHVGDEEGPASVRIEAGEGAQQGRARSGVEHESGIEVAAIGCPGVGQRAGQRRVRVAR